MNWQESQRVVVVDHPMVQHKLSILRDVTTPTKQFRELVREIAVFEMCEATRDLPLEDVSVTTPICETVCKQIAGPKLVLVPILRAGLGMLDGALDVVPNAKVGHLGMCRDEETFEPHAYFDRMPEDVADRDVIIVDPMLATGGSCVMAVNYLRERGVRNIKIVVMVSAPEGIQALLDADPDVRIYTAAVDEKLNEHAYIVPGLGDAGDRIFGTE